MRSLAPVLLLFGAGLWGCSSSSATDGGSLPDMGTASPPDAGTSPDLGTSVDTGGGSDSGAPVDSGMSMGSEDGGLPMGVAPIGRSDMAFATDPDTGKVYMVDGDKAVPVQCNPSPSDFVEDAFVFDPATGRWAQIDTSASTAKPLVRVRGAGAWDKMRHRLIVFGGRYRNGTAGAYTYLNDVWALDPTTGMWTQLSAQGAAGAPSGRMNTVLVADPDHDRVLVHAGGQVSGFMFAVTGDTWAFNFADNSWHQIGRTGGPMPRLFHVAALDKMRHRLYVWGGAGADAFTATTFYQDLWYLDLDMDKWTQVPTAASFPSGRIKGAIQYDAARDRVVFFGGHDNVGVTNDVWTFDLNALTWTQQIVGDRITGMATGQCMFPANYATIDPMSPERREAHLFSITGDRALAFSGETDCGISNDTWMLDLTQMKWMQVSASFSGLTCHRSGRTDCDQANAPLCG